MRAETLALFRRVGGSGPTEGVTVTAPVTPETPTVTPVTPVTPRFAKFGEAERGRRSFDVDALAEAEWQERAGMAADGVPAVFLETWAKLNCRKPVRVGEAEWRQALNDGGLFLDTWGELAEGLGWTPAALFDVGRGLVWSLGGERVEALGPDHARLSDGRTLIMENRL